eukprot:scaffold647833_cov22-Prasinocladus_malaysianus.AAC.1
MDNFRILCRCAKTIGREVRHVRDSIYRDGYTVLATFQTELIFAVFWSEVKHFRSEVTHLFSRTNDINWPEGFNEVLVADLLREQMSA